MPVFTYVQCFLSSVNLGLNPAHLPYLTVSLKHFLPDVLDLLSYPGLDPLPVAVETSYSKQYENCDCCNCPS